MSIGLREGVRSNALAILLACLLCWALLAAPVRAAEKPDHRLRATPENTVLGGFPTDAPAALEIDSGDSVRIDTISSSGATNPNIHPYDYFAALGVGQGEVMPDLVRFWESLPSRTRYLGPHIMTGPVYVEGAEPGDMIEIRILDLDTRVPYGVNSTGPESGVFAPFYPGWRTGDEGLLGIPAEIPADAPGGVLPDVRQHLIRTGKQKRDEVAFFSEDVTIPMQMHMGVMALAPATGSFVGNTPDAPPPADGVQSSTQPGPYGGNMDVRDLTEGASLYLPVEQTGGLFYTGDSHGVQGNGEVSGTALEQSLSGTFRFILHKGEQRLSAPRAEDEDNYIVMGIDHDLDRAMRKAVREMVDFLVEEKGMTESKAYSLASLAGDFQVAEVVDRTQVITGKLDKDLFEDERRRSRR